MLSEGYSNVNIALGQPAYQSSTEYSPRGPEKAVDGLLGKTVELLSQCTHTLTEDNPWWAVELEHSVYVSRVDILNRVDCCGKY